MVDTGDLIQRYEVSLSWMLNDILTLDQQWLLKPIRLSINVMTFIPNLTFTELWVVFHGAFCNGCGMPAGNAYPSGYLVPSLFLGLACTTIVETGFLELAMSLLDFSHWMPLGTFSILLHPSILVVFHQLIRYVKTCYSYECFILRAVRLSNKLLG